MQITNPLRILFVTPYKPDLIRVRPYQFIRHLAKLGHKITLVFYDSPQNLLVDNELRSLCEDIFPIPITKTKVLFNSLKNLPTNKPFQASYGINKKMFIQIEKLIKNEYSPFDVIHFEHLRSVDFGIKLKEMNISNHTPIVWDSVDSITHLFRQASIHHPLWIGRKFLEVETQRTSIYEPRVASVFNKVLVTSQTDLNVFVELLTKLKINADLVVLPNGVDLENFTPDINQKREENTLVISGKMSYHANQKMVSNLVKEIMPLIWKKNPDVRLWVVGQNPSKEIINFGEDPRITITGWVPEMRSFLQKATIAVAPLAYGAGIQNKILEAMACETPVITSSSALNALSAIPGQDLLVADDVESFANLTIDLLSNPSRMEKIGKAGRLFVENHHSWQKAAEKLLQIYQESINSSHSLYS
ncbi:MAG: glycosyltransferase [Anaerolineaceae bacterium]|nr:MAG: glycosyl transferase family 1 [Chloroflexi bacterium HGW-Chloroflexi-8]